MKSNLEYFVVPDGTLYITLDGESFDYLDLKTKISIFLDIHAKVKIIITLPDLRKSLHSDVQKDFNLSTHPTTFFHLDLDSIPSDLVWNKYRGSFNIVLVDGSNLDIFKNFITTSYNKDLNKINWEQVMSQDNLQNYLVQEKTTLEFVGSFSLGLAGDTIQLQSVAGRSNKYTFEGGKKLPILTAASLEVAKSQGNLDKDFIFTSSKEKLAKLYGELGFEVTTHYQTWVLESKN